LASLLFAVVFRHPAKLVSLDIKTGTETQQLDTCGDADDVFFDSQRRRIMSCSDLRSIEQAWPCTTGECRFLFMMCELAHTSRGNMLAKNLAESGPLAGTG